MAYQTVDDYKAAAAKIATDVLDSTTMRTSEGMRLALEMAAAQGMSYVIRRLRDDQMRSIEEMRNRTPDSPGC